MSWLKSTRKATKIFKNKNSFNNAVSNLKATKTNIKNIDDVFKNLPCELKKNEMFVNGKSWRSIHGDLRIGNIRKALKDLNIPNNITAADEATFKKLFTSDVPEIKLNKIKEKINTSKKFHSDLDITGKTATDIEKALKNLNPKSKAKLKASYANIVKVAGGIGFMVVGVYTAITFTGDMYKDLARAAKERDGCFLVNTLNGVTTSCKLLSRSCSVESGTPCKNKINEMLPYNINIMLHHFLKNKDYESLKEISNKLSLSVMNNEDIIKILSDSKNIKILQQYYDENFSHNNVPFSNPCELYNKTNGCIACDSSATINSEFYVDDSELAENFTLQCVRYSTVLETIVELGESLAIGVFDAATSNSIGTRNLLPILFMFLITLLSISLGFRFLGTNNNNNNNNVEKPEEILLLENLKNEQPQLFING